MGEVTGKVTERSNVRCFLPAQSACQRPNCCRQEAAVQAVTYNYGWEAAWWFAGTAYNNKNLVTRLSGNEDGIFEILETKRII